jgi:hypothetical protein
MVIVARKEKSKSISGKHRVYHNVFFVTEESIVEAKEHRRIKIEPTYKKGEAYELHIKPPEKNSTYVAEIRLVQNPRKKVQGWIRVYDWQGNTKLVVVYRKLKIRRSRGDPALEWVVRKLVDHLKIPVKRYNFNTGMTGL